jgi:hypothetical protein
MRRLLSPPVVAWVAHVAFVLGVSAASIKLTPVRADRRSQLEGVEKYLVSPLAVWDGGWYIGIAQHGYDQLPETSAFWPLYPTVLDLGNALTGLTHATIGVIVSNAAFLPALVAMFVLVREDYGPEIATRAVWLAAFSPLAFFFSAVYTEALFLLLTVGSLALARSNRWTWAALAAALASLTRNTGVLIVLPLGIMLIPQRGGDPRRWWPRGIQLAAAALTPLVFVVHIDRIWGDPWLSIRIQEKWERSASTPWDTLLTALHRMYRIYAAGWHSCEVRLNHGTLTACSEAFEVRGSTIHDDLSLIFVFGCLALLPYALWRLLHRESVYLVAGLMAPLFNQAEDDPLMSMARYLIVLYPLYIVLALLLHWRPLFLATLAVSTVSLAWFLYLFTHWYFVA